MFISIPWINMMILNQILSPLLWSVKDCGLMVCFVDGDFYMYIIRRWERSLTTEWIFPITNHSLTWSGTVFLLYQVIVCSPPHNSISIALRRAGEPGVRLTAEGQWGKLHRTPLIFMPGWHAHRMCRAHDCPSVGCCQGVHFILQWRPMLWTLCPNLKMAFSCVTDAEITVSFVT